MNLFYDFVINTLEVVDGVKIFIVFFHPFPHLGNVIAFRITMFSLFLFFLDLFFPIVYVFLGETLFFHDSGDLYLRTYQLFIKAFDITGGFYPEGGFSARVGNEATAS